MDKVAEYKEWIYNGAIGKKSLQAGRDTIKELIKKKDLNIDNISKIKNHIRDTFNKKGG
jgi:hypothetical protein